MHRTEGPDYAIVSGKRRYTNVGASTVVNKDAMNAFQEEVALAIEASGQTLRTTGALDESGAWGQLLAAIKTLSGRGGNTGVVNPANGFMLGETGGVAKAVTSNSQTITDLSGYTILSAESGGPYADGLIKLEEAAKYNYRTVIISNFTGTRKKVRSNTAADSYSMIIENGSAAQFYHNGTLWYPIRPFVPRDTDGLVEGVANLYFSGKTSDNLPEGSTNKYVLKDSNTFRMDLYNAANTSLDNGTASWRTVDGWAELHIPQLSGGTTGLFHLGAISNGAFPAPIQPGGGPYFPLMVTLDASPTFVTMTGRIALATSNQIAIYGTAAASSGILVLEQNIRYKL